jgi:hypothetical protein
MAGRLFVNWVYGGVLAGVMLLALMPLLAAQWSLAFALVVLLLPLYMLHQYEEHDADRFRSFVNEHMGGGLEVLSPAAVFIINIGAVWVLDVVVIWLAWQVDLGLGLIIAYLALVNGITHVVGAVVTRGYNPGLVTAVVLLIPGSIAVIWAVQAAGAGSLRDHLIGIVVAILVHALIVAWVNLRRHALSPRAA